MLTLAQLVRATVDLVGEATPLHADSSFAAVIRLAAESLSELAGPGHEPVADPVTALAELVDDLVAGAIGSHQCADA